jgi:hypothetical protein
VRLTTCWNGLGAHRALPRLARWITAGSDRIFP